MLLALLTMTLIVCGAAFSGYQTKWGFRDDDARLSVAASLDGTAHRPFAYRRLIPDLVTWAERASTPATRAAWVAVAVPAFGPDAALVRTADPGDSYRYVLVYLLTFLGACAVFAAAFAFASQSGFAPATAYIAAAAFTLLFPVLQGNGGHAYDFVEQAAFCALLAAAARGRWDYVLLLAAVGTWNKESFLLFLPTCLPFLLQRLSRPRALALLAVAGAIAVAVYAVQRHRFGANPGASIELHIWDQISAYTHIGGLLRFQTVYGIALPIPSTPLGLLTLAGLAFAGWKAVPQVARHHAALAAAINIPLYVLFCADAETRNLSMLFPTVLLLIAASLQQAGTGRIAPQGDARAPQPAADKR